MATTVFTVATFVALPGVVLAVTVWREQRRNRD